MDNQIFVVYHEDCLDGYGAAWAAYKLFGDEATYIPGQAGSSPPEAVQEAEGATVYAVDLAWPPGILNHLAERNKKVVIIDHHKTAAEWYDEYTPPENVEINMDMEHSGAVLSWKYFHREKQIPELLLYIEDRDLWKWELQDSEAVLLAVDAYPYTWGNMDRLVANLDRLRVEGPAILKYRNQMLDLQLKSAHMIRFMLSEDEVYTVPAVNCSIRALASESCHELLQRYPDKPFVAAYRRNKNGMWNWSLRSRGDFDVADFAKRYAKGGGHKAAAGMSTEDLPYFVTIVEE